MIGFDGFIPKTYIAVVSKPGYHYTCDGFVTATPEIKSDDSPNEPVVYFAGKQIFKGIVPAKVITLLGECFDTGPQEYERWKNNPTEEYRPHQGMAAGMGQIFNLFIGLILVLIGLIIGAALLGFGLLESLILGFLTFVLLMWLLFLPLRIRRHLLEKKFTKYFVDTIKSDECWLNNREEVIAVLHAIASLPTKRGVNNPKALVSGAKKVLKLLA